VPDLVGSSYCPVVRDDRVLPVCPGSPVRFDPAKPRSEPVSPEQWGERYMVDVDLAGEGGNPQPDAHREHYRHRE